MEYVLINHNGLYYARIGNANPFRHIKGQPVYYATDIKGAFVFNEEDLPGLVTRAEWVAPYNKFTAVELYKQIVLQEEKQNSVIKIGKGLLQYKAPELNPQQHHDFLFNTWWQRNKGYVIGFGAFAAFCCVIYILTRITGGAIFI